MLTKGLAKSLALPWVLLAGGWLTFLGGHLAFAEEPPPVPFDSEESRHGFADFESLPTPPSDLPPDSHQTAPIPDSPDTRDETPKGLFLDITLAEAFEEDLEFRRGHLFYPVRPTAVFQTDALAVYLVFRVYKHYAAYQVIGRLYPEQVQNLSTPGWFDEDAAFLELEDESGYLKFFPPSEGWKPGRYRVEIYVGYEVSGVNRMGTLRFTMKDSEIAEPEG